MLLKTIALAGCAQLALASVIPQNAAEQKPMTASEGRRLIELAPYVQRWMTEKEIDELIIKDTPFMDITDYQDLGVPSSSLVSDPLPKLPTTPRVPDAVFPLFEKFDINFMKSFLTNFSSFQNRYYETYGAKSAQFLFDIVSGFAQQSSNKVTVRKFENPYPQFSIIARFEGANPDAETVIIGAHQDSINGRDRREGRAPGADDDGSGTTTILEVFRVLCASPEFKPQRPVEFHWYSAEEVGLWGSQAIAKDYKTRGVKVYAMLQNDMTGYVDPVTRRAGVKHFGLITDYVDRDLTNFVESLMKKYSSMTIRYSKCNYGCSDHASWYKAGYRSAFPFEGEFREMSPFVHTEKDDITTVDFEHMLEYSKLALAFAVELSYP